MPLSAASVLAYIRQHGPAVPNQLRQALGAQDNFLVGAVLSELVAAGDLAMTDLSYGTSRFYYDPKSPASIEQLGKHLGEKDQRAFTLLKTERVVRNTALTPLNRVAMTQIKDFAHPLKLQTPEGPELFWRYYLVSEEEAMDLIEETFFRTYKTAPVSTPSPASASNPAPVPVTAPIITPSTAAGTLPGSTHASTPLPATPPQPASPPVLPLAAPPASKPVKEPKAAKTAKKRPSAKKPAVQTVPATEPLTRLPPVSVAQANPFATAIHAFFTTKQIALVQNIASTKTEFSAIVRIPSAVGAVEYFCKAKSKKTTTDGDLASAILESQQYKLPLLYLSAGKLTKKASDLLPGLKGAVVAQLGEEASFEGEE